MEFLITESQLKKILQEQKDSKFSDNMKTLYSFTSNLVNRVSKAYGVNLKMLLMWGTSVGGMVLPLDFYIRNGEFNLTDDQRYLVLAGVIFILFFEGRRGINKILKVIKDEGLENEFDKVLQKGTALKESFSGFLESLKLTSSVFMETVAYSFLIPIITDIMEMSRNTSSPNEIAARIAERLLASGVVLLSREALTTILRRIIKRLK